MRCRLPGPQLPAQTASSPVRCASAPAAKAPTSSCRTWIHSILPCRRMDVGQAIEAIADDSVDPFDARGGEGLRELIGYRLCHGYSPSCDRARALAATRSGNDKDRLATALRRDEVVKRVDSWRRARREGVDCRRRPCRWRRPGAPSPLRRSERCKHGSSSRYW